MAFITPDENRQQKVMPMGPLNTDPTFVAMMKKPHVEWYTLSKGYGLKNVESKIIVDDVLLYRRSSKNLLGYLRTVMYANKHHRATLKLKKCKWFQDRCECLRMELSVIFQK